MQEAGQIDAFFKHTEEWYSKICTSIILLKFIIGTNVLLYHLKTKDQGSEDHSN